MVCQGLFGCLSICSLMLIAVACSRTPPNFIAIDTAKRSDTWALERADVDCKAQVHSENWSDRFRLRHRVDPDYIACMNQKGFVEEQRAAQ